jgi:hypothetical protein
MEGLTLELMINFLMFKVYFYIISKFESDVPPIFKGCDVNGVFIFILKCMI